MLTRFKHCHSLSKPKYCESWAGRYTISHRTHILSNSAVKLIEKMLYQWLHLTIFCFQYSTHPFLSLHLQSSISSCIFELQVIIPIKNMEKPTNATEVFSLLKATNNYFDCALLGCLMTCFYSASLTLFSSYRCKFYTLIGFHSIWSKANDVLLYYTGRNHLPGSFSIKYWSCRALAAEDNQDIFANVLLLFLNYRKNIIKN